MGSHMGLRSIGPKNWRPRSGLFFFPCPEQSAGFFISFLRKAPINFQRIHAIQVGDEPVAAAAGHGEREREDVGFPLNFLISVRFRSPYIPFSLFFPVVPLPLMFPVIKYENEDG